MHGPFGATPTRRVGATSVRTLPLAAMMTGGAWLHAPSSHSTAPATARDYSGGYQVVTRAPTPYRTTLSGQIAGSGVMPTWRQRIARDQMDGLRVQVRKPPEMVI